MLGRSETTSKVPRRAAVWAGMLVLLAALLSACATESKQLTTTATTGATLYIDCPFSGKSIALGEGDYNVGDLAALGMPNDQVSSLRVADGYKLEIFLDKDFSGRSLGFTADDDCLVNNNFNDLLSSVRVTRTSGDSNQLLPPAPGGRINMRVLNRTNGAYPDSQVYWAIIGYNPATNALSYLNRSGNLVAASPADNTAPGHLSKNGKNYANYFNRVSDVGTFTLPKLYGTRIFLSVGSPMYIEILGVPGGVGFAGPDISNPSDPNQDVVFDFGEFTYNDVGFFGNNTRVDQFGFPVRMRLVGDGGAYDETVGENVSRAQIFSDFATLPQTEFRSLARPPYRIVAPKAGVFGRGGGQANYFQGYIDQIWESYRSRDLVLTNDAGVFRGRVQGDNFVFSKDGGPSGLILEKPNSIMVFEANGAFDKGNGLEKVIGAQVAAAINRHVVIDVDPSRWADDSLYYRNAPANFYADFWHKRSIGGKAYGFAYDDVFSKATLLQSPNPQQVDFIVGW